ncbi:MAG: hypothetical protein RSE93_04625, partial [Oscillospiraceae bacterium]
HTNSQNRELKRATNEFIENALKHSEEILSSALQDIKSTRQALKTPAQKRANSVPTVNINIPTSNKPE